jgi:hypothetical protein
VSDPSMVIVPPNYGVARGWREFNYSNISQSNDLLHGGVYVARPLSHVYLTRSAAGPSAQLNNYSWFMARIQPGQIIGGYEVILVCSNYVVVCAVIFCMFIRTMYIITEAWERRRPGH